MIDVVAAGHRVARVAELAGCVLGTVCAVAIIVATVPRKVLAVIQAN